MRDLLSRRARAAYGEHVTELAGRHSERGPVIVRGDAPMSSAPRTDSNGSIGGSTVRHLSEVVSDMLVGMQHV